MRVTVVHSPAARQVLEWTVSLPETATVRQAVEASGLAEACPGLDWRSLTVAIWGRKAAADQALREGDRIELCRPLRVDPKIARRERFQRQGGRTGGLFARGQNRRGK